MTPALGRMDKELLRRLPNKSGERKREKGRMQEQMDEAVQ